MRFDSIGLFWEDLPVSRKRGDIVRPQPPIPDTGWKPPTYFPDLSRANVISIDTETYDPDLLDCGPGWARGVGHIVGVSVGADNGGRWYFPVAHEVEPEDNLDQEKVFAWLRAALANKSQPKVGANILYDLGWLRQHGIEVAGDLYDVQYAEALLHESAQVGLDILGEKYLKEGKESNLLYQWCADFYGGNPTGKQRANIYRSPPRLVGPYAESDADLPLRIIDLQYPHLHSEGLYEVFRMECDLIRLQMDMRFEGVQINISRAEQVREELLKKEVEYQARLKKLVGFECNVNSNDDLSKAFDSIGLAYGRTAKGAPSFTKPFLNSLDHPVGEVIREIRTCQKMVGTFIDSYLLKNHINEKVYCQFHALRGEGGGTRSGRYSSSTPNLQNIPSRDPVLGPLLRSMFIPDHGHLYWRKYDYSQIEYRFLVHYAQGPGSYAIQQFFNDNPDADYHQVTQQLVKDKTGIWLERKAIKGINFGLIYGMGIPKLTKTLGLTRVKGKELFAAYHTGAPFVQPTMDYFSKQALSTGTVETIMGRRSRFDLWEPSNRKGIPLPYDKAILQYGGIKRAYAHKALNRALQGSAADLMKKAMLKCYQDGIFNETGIPRLTVHDELNFSDPGGHEKAFKEMLNVMETALSLKIPIKADAEIGENWGHVKEIK